jgi:Tfp pilus assembly protein PilO
MTKTTPIRMDRGNWITVGVLALAAAAYLAISFVPQMRSIAQQQDWLEGKLEYVLAAQRSVRATDAIQRELDEVRAYVDKYDEQLMAQDDLPALYSQISHISKSRGVIATKFEPHPAVAYDSLQKASLSLGVTGPFSAIYGLVNDLEALDTRIWIDGMKIRAGKENGGNTECDMILVVFIDNPEKTD